MAKKKSIGEKIAEVADHVLHPNGSENVEPSSDSADKTEEENTALDREPSQNSKIEAKMNHRKFDKFK